MKKVYIHGSFRGTNFGDYLLLQIINDTIEKYAEENECKFEIIYEGLSDMCSQLLGKKDFTLVEAIWKCDAVICAGGGYFGEPSAHNLRWDLSSLCHHIIPMFLATCMKKRVAIIGTGAGQISNPISRKLLKYIFSKALIISVRDIESKEFINNLGVEREIEVHPDWVMTNRFLSYIPYSETSDNVLLHVNGFDLKTAEIIGQDIVRFSEKHPNTSYTIVTDHNAINYINIINCFLSIMGEQNTKVQNYDNNPYNLLHAINESKIVITSKLHVGICGVQMGKKIISLPQHPKVRRFYNQINYDPMLIKAYSEIKQGDVFNMLEYANNSDRRVDLKKYRGDADINASLVKEFLSNIL